MLTKEEQASQHDKEVKDYENHRLDNVPRSVASMEDQTGISCSNCGSKRVSILRRNTVAEKEQSMLEVSCHECGKTETQEN